MRIFQGINKKGNEMKRYLFLLLLFTPNIMIIGISASDNVTPAYKRAEWGFKSYKADTNIGFYTPKNIAIKSR
ncbi:MAG: hypothetical protein K0U39_09730 [Alphaproteobacteria bacterium]|nr:hypothetical protein [Alphaproteobacteria bacterium]